MHYFMVLLIVLKAVINKSKLSNHKYFCRTTVTLSKMASLQSSVISEAVQEEQCPAALKSYLGKRIHSSLQDWTELTEIEKNEVSDNIVQNIISSTPFDHINVKKYRKEVSETGMHISHILDQPEARKKLQNLKDGIKNVANINILRDEYNKHRELNTIIFKNITTHHNHLIHKTKQNDKVAVEKILEEKDLNLHGYAAAATHMGEKSWVTHGNTWLQTTMIDHYRNGGSKKL